MSETIGFDLEAAHRHFSVQCFNAAWELIDNQARTPAQDVEMIRLSQASHWHWTQRTDYSDTSASVAYWQTARIYALLGQADNAREYGELCLRASQAPAVPPFYLGYAYEELARAESEAGDRDAMNGYIELARRAAEKIEDPDFQQMLLDDIMSIA